MKLGIYDTMVNDYYPELARIRKVINETPDTNSYKLELSDTKLQQDFSYKPGQFMMLSLFGVGESAISLSDISRDGSAVTTIRGVGNVTSTILKLKEGDILGMRGPYGNGWPVEKIKNKDILIVAGGMGIAPLRGVISYIKNNRKDYGHLEIIYGAKTPNDLVFKYDFEKWRKIKNSRFDLTVDRLPTETPFQCNVGLVTSCFPMMKTSTKNSIALICGPEIMMRYVVKCLETIGFKDRQIYLSLERRMKCGLGKCGHCQIGLKYVCMDGPVFNYANIKSFIRPL